MSDAENQHKWNEFVEIGNTIHNMRGQVSMLEAKRAFAIANHLIDNDYLLNQPVKDLQLYKTLIHKINCYLDGNTQGIRDAVIKYFLIQHCKAGLDEYLFQVTFSPKKSRIQTGFTCDINDGSQTTRYFIKTHQHGPTGDNSKSKKAPDATELFVYKFLHHMGIGPEVHFIVPILGTKMTIYIATKDCHLTLLSDLTKDTMNTKALIQLDLISGILYLRDCSTNSSNVGQVDGKPMIVDFRIDKRFSGYFKSHILEEFYEGIGNFTNSVLLAEAAGIPREQKSVFLRDSLQEWNLVETIDHVALEMHTMIQRIGTKVIVDDDLQRYVQDVKETIKVLLQG